MVTVTDDLLSHQLLPEALGRGELVAGLVMLPWILFWWFSRGAAGEAFDLSARAAFLRHLSFPQRSLQAHLCVHSLGAFFPRITETHPAGQGNFTSSLPLQPSQRPQGAQWVLPQGNWLNRDITDNIIFCV